MRTTIKIIWIGVLFFAVAGLASCKKTIETTGTLRVTSNYASASSNGFKIYENMTDSTPILTIFITNKDAEFRLNMGNYFIGSGEYNKTGFQIQAGRTTTVVYDDRGVVTSVSIPN